MKPRILFMGTGAFSGTILGALLDEKYNVAGIFTKPDKNIHKNSATNDNEIKTLALKNNLPLYQPEKLTSEITAEIKKINPDLIVIVAYGKIIPPEIIAIPQFGCVNVHPSLLPKFRGPSPIQNALLSGEKETGTTIMLINEKMDAGDILAQEKLTIHPDEIYPEFSERLALLSAKLLLETLPRWIAREIIPIKQDDAKATLCRLIQREDGKIDWNEEAEKIYDRYRALSPWPGIFSFWKKENAVLRLKLQKIKLLEMVFENDFPAGRIFELDGKIAVQCGKGAIILEEVQLEGKKKTPIHNFTNGYPDFKKATLE
jgi:methionyl-tRNA formyltransferase